MIWKILDYALIGSPFSVFRPLGGSSKWELIVEVGQWEPTIFKGKNGSDRKFGPQLARA